MNSADSHLLKVIQLAKRELVYDESEYENMERDALILANRLKDFIKRNLNVICEPVIAGSLAKRTMVRGFSDIDIFLLFDPNINKEQLKRIILLIGKQVFKGKFITRYAEHPYIEVFYNERRTSIVPAYKVPKGNWKSPVDRTYYHVMYIKEKYNKNPLLRTDAVLLKAFMRKIGVYGAEVYVKGFSGYLCDRLQP